MESLGKIVQSIITPLLNWFKEDYVGPALAGIISLAGLILIIYIVRKTIKNIEIVEEAISVVASSNENQFALHFNKIDQELQEIPKIKIAWSEFSETLLRPIIDEYGNVKTPCSNTYRPQIYFNSEEMGMEFSFLRIMPSIFVGVGLSLTFLGLISALTEAVGVIGSAGNNTQSIQTGIGDLLRISSAKFYASLFALVMSVLLTLTIRGSSSYLEKIIATLNRDIEEGIKFLSLEQLEIDRNHILREQLTQLQTFNTDLAMKIGQQIQSSLSDALIPMITTLTNIGEKLTDQNISALQSIVEEVVASIRGATSESMEKVASTLDEIALKLGGLSDSLSNALSNFDTSFTEMLLGLKTSLEGSTQGMAEQIGKSVQSISSEVSSTAIQVGNTLNNFVDTIQNVEGLFQEISKKGTDDLRNQVDVASRNASEQLSNAGRMLSLGFQETTEGLVKALSETTTELNKLGSELNTLPAQLNSINASIGDSSTEIEISSRNFSQATSSIREIVEPLAEFSKNTNDSVNQIMISLQGVTEKISLASENINESVNILNRQVGEQLQRIDGSDEILGTMLTQIQDSTGRVLSQINEFVTQMDSGIAKSIGLLRESIEELQETVESIKE